MAGNDIQLNTDASNARRYIDINAKQLSKANASLASGLLTSDPSEAPAASAIGASFASNIAALTQAQANVIQAASFVQQASGIAASIADILTTASGLSAQANSGVLDASLLGIINLELQSLFAQVDTNSAGKFNNTTIFTGGVNSSPNRLGTAAATTVTPGSTTAYSAIATQNFVAGSIDPKSVSVAASGSGDAVITLAIGGQTYIGVQSLTAATGTVNLVSTSNSNNQISLTIAAAATDTKTLETNLRTFFELDVGTPLSFKSASTAQTTVTSITAGAGAATGTYALSSGYDKLSGNVTYTLQQGSNISTLTHAASASTTAAQTLTFNNGISIVVAAGTNEQAPIAGVEIFTVAPGAENQVTVQIGANSSDILTLSLPALSSSALGLSGSSVLSQNDAISTASAISSALTTVNNLISQLGGQKLQLNYQAEALALSVQNEAAAKATFTDADIAKSLQDSTQYQALVNISSSVFGNLLQEPGRLADMVRSTLR